MEAPTPPLARDLRGCVALVTGGARRVGLVVARALADRGAHVVITWSSSGAAAQAAVEELRPADASSSRRAHAVQCDVSSETDVEALFEEVEREFGRLDLLVNNAAIFERTPFPEMDLDSWKRHLDVNLTGSFLCARGATKLMLAGDGGVIVNVACVGGVRPWPAHLAYCVSKAGVVMLTQVLARAVGPRIRVNAIAPGPVLLPEDYSEAERERAVKATVLQRSGVPEDVARAVLFCWDSDFTTGALIPVDGGRLVI